LFVSPADLTIFRRLSFHCLRSEQALEAQIPGQPIKLSHHVYGIPRSNVSRHRSAALRFHREQNVLFKPAEGLLAGVEKNWGHAMKPVRPLYPGLIDVRRYWARAAIAALGCIVLAGCDQNTYVPPPPPKVDVAVPLKRAVTRYLEATGNTAAIKSVDLVARVQGFLASIDYKDGDFVKEGTTLFTIEPETYKLKLDQAQAAQAGAEATLKQAEFDFRRQTDLVARQAVAQATLDTSTSNRDNAQANLQQAEANTRIAEVNYGYTKVTAPFDGFVSAHLVSVGELVGAASPTQLASIVALDPIYVNFNVNEQDVLRIRSEASRRGVTVAELRQLPVQVGLQIEQGYPHEGKLDYIAPTINQTTGTLAVRGIVPNPNRQMLPGYFVRVRVPYDQLGDALLVPDTSLGSDQGGRYLLVVNGDNVVEQRHVQMGPLEDGGLRVIEDGLKPEDRVVVAGLLRAIPGQKVDPQLQKTDASAASAK
jgi:RND family efflux transporter MFP subunit